MKTTVIEAGLRPYDDGSGFREEVIAKWVRDDSGKDIVAQIEIKQGDQRVVFTFSEWTNLRDAANEAIAETHWIGTVTNGE